MDHSVYGKELEASSVNVGKWYGVESLLFKMGSVGLESSYSDVHLFSRELQWPHHKFYLNHFYVEGRGQIDMKYWLC